MGEKPTGYSVIQKPKRGESVSHILDFLFRPVSVLDSIVLLWLFKKCHAHKSANKLLLA